MKRINETIAAHRDEILTKERLRMTPAQWDNLLARLEKFYDKIDAEKSGAKSKGEPECYDEQIWTFLVACGYAIAGEAGLQKIGAILTGCGDTPSSPIWMEALPYPPRKREGNTNLDLACGGIGDRDTDGKEDRLGIQYDPARDHIVFCEMKWYSDISTKVTHDQQRNQLARVIENAVTFQDGQRNMPENCTVTLVTPEAFKQEPKSRLYHYKFDEYFAHPECVVAEFDQSDARMPKRDKPKWSYPENIAERLATLQLNWVTFEDLIKGIPAESVLREEIIQFESEYNKSDPVRE